MIPQATFDLAESGGFAFAEGSTWMADSDTLLRVDPTTNQTIARIRVGPDSKFVYADHAHLKPPTSAH